MAKLSKVDAAKATGVSRQTLYTYLKDGRLSADADGLIDTAELLRAGFALHTGHEIGRQEVLSTGHELTSSVGQPLTSKLDTLDVYLDMIALLKQQLSETQAQAQARDQAAQERERDYREHIARLTAMLDQAHQQNQRLLDLPRTPSAGGLQDAPGQAQSSRRVSRPPPPPATPQAPSYDTTRYRLGGLCARGHQFADTGKTLRRVPNGACPQCETAQQRERRAARRRPPQESENDAYDTR